MAAKMVEQEQHDLTHGNGEDQEPADARDQKEEGRDDTIEVDVEDDTAEGPFATSKEAVLCLRCI